MLWGRISCTVWVLSPVGPEGETEEVCSCSSAPFALNLQLWPWKMHKWGGRKQQAPWSTLCRAWAEQPRLKRRYGKRHVSACYQLHTFWPCQQPYQHPSTRPHHTLPFLSALCFLRSSRAAVVQSHAHWGCSLISRQCWDDWGRQDQAYQLCDWKMVIGDKNMKEDTLVAAVVVLLESGWEINVPGRLHFLNVPVSCWSWVQLWVFLCW